jgi:hypothetical protein
MPMSLSLRPASRLAAIVLAITASSLGWSRAALAAHHRFEPTDLDLQDPGLLEADLQLGFARGDGPARVVLPDAEINLGLAPNVEVDVDFAFGVEGRPRGAFTFDHAVADNVWLATKIGLWDQRDDAARTAWAFGVQLGPKLPFAPDARGVGYEALLLFGRTVRGTHLALDAGALVDPGAEVARRRPIGVELGLDLDQDLDRAGAFSLLGEIGGIHWLTGDADQLQVTAALQWSPSDLLDLSLGGSVGLLPGSDRYAVLLGISPKVRLWQ